MTDDIPQWALERVCEITNADGSTYHPESFTTKTAGSYSIGKAFARYIVAHEEPPVDTLLIEARAMCARNVEGDSDNPMRVACANQYYEGTRDKEPEVQLALAALRRGMELAK